MALSPKALLDSHDILPKKSLGQNFMHDPKALEKIVACAELRPSDIAVEVGAGTGTLTEKISVAAAEVFALEIDERLWPILEERFDNTPNVYLIFGDVLKTDVTTLVGNQDYVVIANAPYYISSAILWHFLEAQRPPQRMIMTMQLEVAERIISQPGAMNLLSIAVQLYGRPRVVGKFRPAVFWPRPNIHSAVIRIDTHKSAPVDIPSTQAFFRVVRAGFSLKRKQLKNALSRGLGVNAALGSRLLASADIDPRRRAETLTLEEWARLTRKVADPAL